MRCTPHGAEEKLEVTNGVTVRSSRLRSTGRKRMDDNDEGDDEVDDDDVDVDVVSDVDCDCDSD